MGTCKKFLTIDELRVGMISAREIKSEGRVLIGAGLPISKIILNKLRKSYFDNKFEIYYESDDMDARYNNKMKTVEQVNKSLDEIAFDMQQLFYNMQYLRSLKLDEVRKFAAKIQQELKSTSSVIKNIVLHGSGRDTIYRHCVNVTALSTFLGEWIGLDEKQLNLLTYSAVLHDFGKIKIDKNILDKPGSLTPNEFDIIKEHPIIGYNYINKIPFLDKSVVYGVLMHHEKMDGSGYPLGLKNDKIHQFAKIIAIADVFDAVNSNRIYQNSKKPFEALELVYSEGHGKLDYEYCMVFLNHVINYYMGENVVLNNGKVCKIIHIDTNNIERPLLFDSKDFIDLKNNKDLYIEKLIL